MSDSAGRLCVSSAACDALPAIGFRNAACQGIGAGVLTELVARPVENSMIDSFRVGGVVLANRVHLVSLPSKCCGDRRLPVAGLSGIMPRRAARAQVMP